jgi:hypothetical protein
MKKWVWLLFALALFSANFLLLMGNLNFISDTGMLILFGSATIVSARYGRHFLSRKI